MVETWAVILTHNRHEMLSNLLADTTDVKVVVVDHKSDPPVTADVAAVIRDDGEANIQRLWNRGLDTVAALAEDSYNVAVLNDDVRLPPGLLLTLAENLRVSGASIAFPDQHELLPAGSTDMRRRAGPVNLFTRMTGYCYMMRGEKGLRLDESFVWWYGDDDLEWRAATAGGVLRVGGLKVEHLDPNGSTNRSAELAEQTGIDRATFIAKWHRSPW